MEEATTVKKRSPTHAIYQSSVDVLVIAKRKARREWQKHRSPQSKLVLREATALLRKQLSVFRNNQIQSFLANLGPQKEQNYSLWKASSIDKVPTNSFSPLRKDDGSWAQSDSEKGTILASHLSNVFKPYPKQIDFGPVFYTPDTVSHPPKVTFEELKETIDKINIKKAPGYDKKFSL